MTTSIPQSVPPHSDGRAAGEFRAELTMVALGVCGLAVFLQVVDTGSLAQWVATNSHGKIDEAIFFSFAFMVTLGFVAVRRSRRLAASLATPQLITEAGGLERASAFRRDAIGLTIALVIAVGAASVFDTGRLAEWVAAQSHTLLDETIVSIVVLVIGLVIFSVRRCVELSRQLVRSEALARSMTKLNNDAATLAELVDLLQACRSTDEAYPLIAKRAESLFSHTSGAVYAMAPSRDFVEVKASWGHPAVAARAFAPADCWAIRRGRVHVLGADGGGVQCAHIGPARPVRAICVPMIAQGEAIGVLYIDTHDSGSELSGPSTTGWSDAEQRLAGTLSEHAALAVANLMLRETLQRQSVLDPLTGLHNRRYLEESLERELRRSTRTGTSFGVMMIDVDHFKHLNDTSGHEAGDAVLRALAVQLRAQLRSEDILCRYGGEEFTMILAGSPLEATRARAESLRSAVERLTVKSQGQTLPPVTISIGVSTFPEHGATSEELMSTADKALYGAKRAGRNRVLAA